MTSKIKICLGLFALFLAGLIIGSAATLHLVKDRIGPGFMRQTGDPMDRLGKILSLRADQKQTLRPIVEKTLLRLREEHREHQARMQLNLDQGLEEIRPHLEHAQMEKLLEVRNKMRKRFGKGNNNRDHKGRMVEIN